VDRLVIGERLRGDRAICVKPTFWELDIDNAIPVEHLAFAVVVFRMVLFTKINRFTVNRFLSGAGVSCCKTPSIAIAGIGSGFIPINAKSECRRSGSLKVVVSSGLRLKSSSCVVKDRGKAFLSVGYAGTTI
jgi:hypothetical protein